MDAQARPSRRARQRARREKAAAEGKCQGKNRRGKPCKLTPKTGNSVCWRHGARGGRPIVHGRYSELPERVRARYLASLTDDSLFDHAQTVAALDGLVREAAARAADLDTPLFRKLALETLSTARELIADGKDPIDCLGPLEALLDKGLAQVIAEDRLFRLLERLDTRIEAANRLKLSKQTAINAVDLVGVMQALLAAIQRLAPADLAKQLADELEKILGGVDVQPIQIGRG